MLTDPFSTNRITSTIIGAAIRVHRVTGPGLLESAYVPCLLFELQNAGLSVAVQYPIPLVYRDIRMDAVYRADMLVDDTVLVELKSVESLAPIHTAQMLTYLKLSRKPVGLLINFNASVLKSGLKRIVNPEMVKSAQSSSEGDGVPSPPDPFPLDTDPLDSDPPDPDPPDPSFPE
jgi:GxxExxY protein